MELTLDEVQSRISHTEDARSADVTRMKDWEKMYCLDAGFTQEWQESVKKEGREQVVTPDPYNVVGLAMRLIPSQPKIDIPPRRNDEPANQDAEQVERWLTAMYNRVNFQQGKNFVEDLKMLLFKRGRGYVQALWIRDELPEKLQKKAFPLLIRTLDPLEVGFYRGPYYVEYAYHKYEAEKVELRQKYPSLALWDKEKPKGKSRLKPAASTESDTLCVTDFWYVDQSSGAVWNCLIVEEEFAKKPTETDYPFIPIIEVKGEGDGKSLLHAINGLWQYQCRLYSNVGTGVLWATWPFFQVMNDQGHEVPDFEVRPLATQQTPVGTVINQVHPDVNLNVLNDMTAKVEAKMSQATFPAVLYGDAGNMQAGYGVNILSQAASGRVKIAAESLEMALMWLNELVLALVEEFDEGQGVELWGRDAGSEKLYRLCLYKNQIDGYYENAVQLKLNLPTDDMAKQTFGLRLVESKVLSKQTYWDKFLGITVPSDEQDRIYAEQAMEHPEVQQKLVALSFMDLYPATWEVALAGTKLLDDAYQMAEKVFPLEKLINNENYVAWKAKQISKASSELSRTPAMPPPLPGPAIPLAGTGGPLPLQPHPMMSGPMGGGVPPVMQGQLSPNTIGLPQQGAELPFAQATNQPLAPNEELALLAGGQ